jgi:hypothetical protein
MFSEMTSCSMVDIYITEGPVASIIIFRESFRPEDESSKFVPDVAYVSTIFNDIPSFRIRRRTICLSMIHTSTQPPSSG